MHHPTDRIIHTTPFVTPGVDHWLEREIAQLVHPMKDIIIIIKRTNAPTFQYKPGMYKLYFVNELVKNGGHLLL